MVPLSGWAEPPKKRVVEKRVVEFKTNIFKE
jgi:hypothetical protein